MNSKFVITLICFAMFFSCAEDKKTNEKDNIETITSTTSINNTSWMVIDLKGETTFSRNPTIHVDAFGTRISGSTSCNKYFGNAIIEKDSIKVLDVGSTKMMCKDIEIENLFLKTLNEISKYKISGEELKLLSADNKVLMQCSPIIDVK